MRSRWGVGVLAIVILGGCGKAAEQPRQPETTVRLMLDGVFLSNPRMVHKTTVTPERLRKAITCKGDPNLISQLEDQLTGLDNELMLRVRFEILSIEEADRRSIVAGGTYRDCVASEPFEVRTFKVIRTHAIGQLPPEKVDELVDVVHLDREWLVSGRQLKPAPPAN